MIFGDRISPNEQFIILVQLARLVSFNLIGSSLCFKFRCFSFFHLQVLRHEPIKTESYRDSRFIAALSTRPSTHDFIITGLINAGGSAGDRHVGFAYPIREGIRQNQEIRVELPRYFKRFHVRGI